MNILWPEMHIYLTQNMASAFKKMGHTLIIPSEEYKPTHHVPWQTKDSMWAWNTYWTQEKVTKEIGSNVLALSKEEILDIKPEIIFLTCVESQPEILNELYPHLKNHSKLVAYSGNDYWDGAYDFSMIRNYLCADYTGFLLSLKYKLNYLYYKPEVNYDFFKYQGVSDGNIFGSYINNYQAGFPNDYDFCFKLMESIKEINFQPCDKCAREEMLKNLKNSIATVHIKRLEGYGYSVIESLAAGRPVFLTRPYSQNKSLQQWCIENKTAFFFDTPEEFKMKALRFIEDKDFRHSTQEQCAKTIREIINNDLEFEKLKNFIDNLV
jgi:hypothetical protein